MTTQVTNVYKHLDTYCHILVLNNDYVGNMHVRQKIDHKYVYWKLCSYKLFRLCSW